MSRSYRKFPVVRQEKINKKYYNRKLRKLKDGTPYKGGQYRRLYICDDWHYRWSREDAIRQYCPNVAFPTLESWLQHWEKFQRK